MCRSSSYDWIGSQLHHKQEVTFWQETLLLRWPPCEFSTPWLHPLYNIYSLTGGRVTAQALVGALHLTNSIADTLLSWTSCCIIAFVLIQTVLICLQLPHHSAHSELSRPWALIEIVSKSCWSSENAICPTYRQMTPKAVKGNDQCFFSYQLISFSALLFFTLSTGHFRLCACWKFGDIFLFIHIIWIIIGVIKIPGSAGAVHLIMTCLN